MRNTILIFFMLSLAASACRHEQQCPTPDVVSYSRDIQPIFDAHCNSTDCHGGTSPERNLNLEPAQSYSELNHPGSGYLDTLKPRSSVLYAQMRSVSTPMPPTGNLDDCTTELVLRWIEQKAKNN